jgi:hypothetical protein
MAFSRIQKRSKKDKDRVKKLSKKTTRKHTKRTKNTKRSKMLSGVAKGVDSNCPNSQVNCNLIDKQYTEGNKLNDTWDTCVNMNGINNHIIYVTSKNVVIKSVETPQVPEFVVKFEGEDEPRTCKIMIEDKYIACFLKICGKWYAMMRLFGKTLNTGFLARTEKNMVFYRISDVEIDANDPVNGTGLIKIPKNSYKDSDSSPIFSTSTTKVIELANKCFENINKQTGDVFNVLQRFRQQKLAGNEAKYQVIVNGVDNGVDFLI